VTDITLTEDEDKPGTVLAHKPHCPMVQQHREAGRPIMTMLGCPDPLPPEMKRHTCLDPSHMS